MIARSGLVSAVFLAALSTWAALPGCGGTVTRTGETGGHALAGASGTSPAGGGRGGAAAGGGGLAPGAGGGSSLGGGCSVDPNDDDMDRDGYKRDVDCNDFQNRVNPGAFDVPGNGVDDDCDGGIDNGPGVGCDDESDVIALDAKEPEALGRAMGLCSRSLLNDPGRRWGISSVELWSLDGPWTAGRDHVQHAVQTTFGQFVPKQGRSMLMLTTGRARLAKQPGGVDGYPALDSPYGEQLPNGFPENDPICLAASSDPDITAWNAIALSVRMRVPTNAARFKWSARAITPESPTQMVCHGENSLFAAFKERYTGSPFAQNFARLPDGSLFSVDHLPWTYCDPETFTEGGRVYDFPCPAGSSMAASARPWWGAATDWQEFVVDVVAGQELELTLIVWGHGSGGRGAFGVFLDDFQWIAGKPADPLCSP